MEACGLRRAVRILIAVAVAVAAIERPASAQTYQIVHAFAGAAGKPSGNLVLGADGSVHGVANNDGMSNSGTVFVLEPDGGGGYTYQTVHEFLGPDGGFPIGGLTPDGRGYLWGTTSTGGANQNGTVFQIDASGRQSVVHSFDRFVDGSFPSGPLMLASDGSLWGTTQLGGPLDDGTVFRIDSLGILTTIYSFHSVGDGYAPRGGLLQTPDGIFGTTWQGGPNNGGTIFRIDAAGTLTTIHVFEGTTGANPIAGLTDGLDGHLYGTATQGGDSIGGVTFRIDPTGDNYEVLHSFTLAEGAGPETRLVRSSGGGFYGTTSYGGPSTEGIVFRMETSGTVKTLHYFDASDGGGVVPNVELVEAPDGTVFGATAGGGPTGWGTVFHMSSGGFVTTIYGFDRRSPVGPVGGVIQADDGLLYGTASFEAPTGYGAVFTLDFSGNFSVLHSFDGSTEGGQVDSPLLQALDGALYSMTHEAGPGDAGSLFKITKGGDFTLLHAFGIGESGAPRGGFVDLGGGLLAGAQTGENIDSGTVFTMDASGAVTPLHIFSGADGSFPAAPPILRNGVLYGSAQLGGANQVGTLYRIQPVGGFSKIHDFAGPDGVAPGQVTLATDGDIYGVTMQGGAHGGGTIFRIDGANAVTTLHDLDPLTEGSSPSALTELPDGNLYGTTTSGGTASAGSVFRLGLDGTLTLLHSFLGPEGASPYGVPLLASDGALYGAAFGGGIGKEGVVYRIYPAEIGTGILVRGPLSPDSGRAAGGTSITFHGEGVAPDATVTVGDVPAIGVADIDTFTLRWVMPPLPPASLPVITIANPGGGSLTLNDFWFADFLDVDSVHPFYDYVDAVGRARITAGCGSGNYCPDTEVTREQMAVFLLKSEHGSGFAPPPCTGVFTDVPCTPGVGFPDWVEQLYAEHVTGGCSASPLLYCPGRAVTRAEMAVFLLKTKHGTGYVPDPCGDIFADVPCPATPEFPYSDWIEQLYADGITGGCATDPLRYCPDNPNLRGEMAVFLTKTFLQ